MNRTTATLGIAFAGVASAVLALPTSDPAGTSEHGVVLAASTATAPQLLGGQVVHQIPSPETDYSHGLAWDGRFLWVCGAFSDSIYQFSPLDGSVVNSYLSPVPHTRGLAWDGTNLWVSGWSPERVYKTDPVDGSILQSFDAPNLEPPEGLAWQDGFLWVSGDTLIYRVDPSDGSVVASVPSPEPDPRGLTWDGEYLWVGFQTSDEIYRLDPSTGAVILSFRSPVAIQQGLAFDGQFLWATGASNIVYQLAVDLDILFRDGFETGDLARWSAAVG